MRSTEQARAQIAEAGRVAASSASSDMFPDSFVRYVLSAGCLPKLYDVVERVRDADGQGKRTDTVTGDLVRAIRRRDEMRRQGRPAYVTDAGGRRVEVSW